MNRERRTFLVAIALSVVAFGPIAARPAADQAAPLSALAQIPIREVTIFKDGYAFVVHEGKMPTDGAGHVLMDYLPTPVLGTFWAHSADAKARLTSVVASQHRVRIDRTALDVRDLIEGNVGASVIISELPAGREAQPLTYAGTIVEVPERSGEELARTGPPNSGERLPQKGNVVLVKTDAGTKVVPFERILDVTFKNAPKPRVAGEEFRNLLSLTLDWGGKTVEREASVGMIYLQRGLRWIPSYKVDLDGKGNAAIKLEATLVNELADLEDVTAQLVVGVPTFAFKDMVDPISLQQAMAQVSSFDQNALLSNRLSNSLMTQVAGGIRAGAPADAGRAPAADLGPEVTGSQRNEDLFVYTVKHVTLKKGQRMVLPVHEVALKYKDIYTVEIPFALPPELPRNQLRINDEQQRELARMLREPTVMHKVRLSNRSSYPLTTAPALILSGDRVLAQGLMTYTPVGADGDLPITQALEIGVKKDDREVRRTLNVETWNGQSYGRVDLAGTISVTNRRDRPTEVELVRYTLGKVTEAGTGGRIQMLDVLDDRSLGDWMPTWWSWSGWPDWMWHFNGVSRITWTVTLEPGRSIDLPYAWNYYWR
jgi:hypothetical protein